MRKTQALMPPPLLTPDGKWPMDIGLQQRRDNSDIREENPDRKGWGYLARKAGESTPVEIVVQESAGMCRICPTLFQAGRVTRGPLRYFPN